MIVNLGNINQNIPMHSFFGFKYLKVKVILKVVNYIRNQIIINNLLKSISINNKKCLYI